MSLRSSGPTPQPTDLGAAFFLRVDGVLGPILGGPVDSGESDARGVAIGFTDSRGRAAMAKTRGVYNEKA